MNPARTTRRTGFKGVWQDETLDKVRSVIGELKFKKALLKNEGQAGGLTVWLEDAILLTEHLLSDLEAL